MHITQPARSSQLPHQNDERLTRASLWADRLCASVYGIEEKRYLVLLAHMLGAQFTSNMRAVNTHLLVRPPAAPLHKTLIQSHSAISQT
jgi:hypothetical protein